MIELTLDPVSNRILGYNDNITTRKEQCLVEDHYISLINEVLLDTDDIGLYYENGKITKKDKSNDLDVQIDSLDIKIQEKKVELENEQAEFMNNIINGMTLEEAREIAKEKRELLIKLEEKKQKLEDTYNIKMREKYYTAFEEEESQIPYKYFLSIVSIVRDENDYIEEWIRYHIEELGFEHFYIYDNESKIPVQTYLESVNFKYLDCLTIIPWKTSYASQQDSHNHFFETYRNETRWFLPADPDEYVLLKNPDGKTLITFLEEHSAYSTIKCPWVHFNANGHVEKTNEPDMIRFTQATTWDDEKHGGKKFSQSNRVLGFHSYVPFERKPELPVLDWDSTDVSDFFQLNHYFTRSYEEWCEKIKRGSSNPDYRRKFSMFFELNPDMMYLYDGKNYKQGYGSQTNQT